MIAAMSNLLFPRRRLCRLWLVAVALLAGFPQAAAAESEEACLTASINAARQEQGSRRLSTDSRLVAIARRHSARMAGDQRFYHNSNLRNELPQGWRSEGENVGWATDCGYMHNFFMNSPAHRKNILGASFNQIGVGVVKDSAGKLWVTEVFMESSGPAGLSSEPDTALTAPPPGVHSHAPSNDATETATPAETRGATAKSVSQPSTSPASKTQPTRTSRLSPRQPGPAPSKAAVDLANAGSATMFGWEGASSELAPIQFDLEANR